MRPRPPLEAALVDLGRDLRDRARRAAVRAGASRPEEVGASDLQYGVDVATEEGLIDAVRAHLGPWLPLRLFSEGLDPEGVVVGEGVPVRRLVVDPIDGTRGLMHDKRSAWALLGVAPDADPRLRTLEAAAMVEIPTRLGGAGEVLSATRGDGWTGSVDVMPGVSGITEPFMRRAADGLSFEHGFVTVARFFPGISRRLDAFATALMREFEARGWAPAGTVFEDQYISNGGQMAALVTGRDRLVVDLRALLGDPGRPIRSGHAYDLLGLLVAEEAGVVITDCSGAELDAPLSMVAPVPWIGYAHRPMRDACAPIVAAVLESVKNA